MATARLIGNEHLEPGGVYYIGDFSAGVDSSWNHNFASPSYHQSWRFGAVENAYDRTTAEMKRAWPRFASVRTEDRVPRQ